MSMKANCKQELEKKGEKFDFENTKIEKVFKVIGKVRRLSIVTITIDE